MYYSTSIKPLIKQWKQEAGVNKVILYRTARKTTVNQSVNDYVNADIELEIFTPRPGPMIGYQGQLVQKYTDLISEKIHHKVIIKFIETDEII